MDDVIKAVGKSIIIFLKADIDEVMEQLDFYSEKIKTGTPDASTALAEYKKHRLKLVEEITSVRIPISVDFRCTDFRNIAEGVQIRKVGLRSGRVDSRGRF